MIRDGSASNRVQLPVHVGQQLVARGTTKTAVVQILSTLWKNGMLKNVEDEEEVDEASLKRQLTVASVQFANTKTPYGTIVQYLDLSATGVQELKQWEFIHPFAWLYQMCVESQPFALLMHGLCCDSRPLRVIIFADGMIPGNPFRPEKSRTLMCVYWAVVDWPAWLLTRSFAWPVLTLVRESLIEKVPGGLGYFMRRILRIFFGDVGKSFRTGIVLPTPRGEVVVTAIFAGFLADLVGHKEITNWKGHGGVVCCLDCDNVKQFRKPKDGEVGMSCCDPSKFKRRSDVDVYAIIEDLRRAYRNLGKTKFLKLETDLGFNYDPHGLLFDDGLRGIYRPGHHTIRDWMHTVGQDGVANTHIAECMHALKEQGGIHGDRVREFADLCKYPSKWGKLDKSAFSDRRLKDHTITSFASVILTMVPVFHLLLEKFVSNVMPLHFQALLNPAIKHNEHAFMYIYVYE